MKQTVIYITSTTLIYSLNMFNFESFTFKGHMGWKSSGAVDTTPSEVMVDTIIHRSYEAPLIHIVSRSSESESERVKHS